MKRASNIKDALFALCRILSSCGSVIDPETFRKAKFNRPEAASAFWKLLYCLLKHIYSRNDVSSNSRNEWGVKGDEIRYVKSILQTQGYGRAAFYGLPNDGSEGSREALLAFSWLIYTAKILEVILEKKRINTGDHNTFCTCPQNMDFRKKKSFIKSTKQDIDVRYLQWLNGRLQLFWQNLYTSHLEKCNMLNKIHLYTQRCQTDQQTHHLSAMETELVKHPEICNTVMQSLESEDSYLQAYLEWRCLETVYWQWMIKEKEKCVEEKEHTLSIKKIKQEMKKKTENHSPLDEQVSSTHGLLRIAFKESKFKVAIHKDFSLKKMYSTDLTTFLQATATKLQTDFQYLQDKSRKKLDAMTAELEGIVCISPAKC
ncbi:tubulin epsilon and delta complex protein 1 isoform X2 [Pyxicephalus adspersus]|uniref:tubulin epsilon and delta complex protein 1 isoform X2 n=1 Tax=Pyxicephalus adspersus TaxID=30357 RepID=UPI003B5C1716